MKTTTPRTDKQINGNPCTRFAIMAGDSLRDAMVPSEFARQLERELTEARAEMPWYANGESKEEWMERQREKYQHLENTIKEVTEQRDDLLRYNEEFRNETLICADCDAIRKEEYDQAIDQRDRLAEAFRIIKSYPSSDEYIYSTAEQALQSLTTNKEDQERKSPASECSEI